MFEHPANALFPIVVTTLGIVSDVTLMQFANP